MRHTEMHLMTNITLHKNWYLLELATDLSWPELTLVHFCFEQEVHETGISVLFGSKKILFNILNHLIKSPSLLDSARSCIALHMR